MKINQLLLFIILFIISTTIFSYAQVKNSIYSIFGIGQVVDDSYGINRSLGSTGIAFQSGRSINQLNPASYLGIEQNSIVIESGVYGMLNYSRNSYISQTTTDIDFSYLSVDYYMTQNWALSFGILPFSSVGYQVNSTEAIQGDLSFFNISHEGSGGLNKIYLGNAFHLFEGLTVGFNSSFIFGNITQTETGLSSDGSNEYILSNAIKAYGFYLDYGLQYSFFYNKLKFTTGIVYGSTKRLNTKNEFDFSFKGTTISINNDEHTTLYLPQKFGIGFAVQDHNHLRAGFDYEWKNWSSLNFSNTNFDAKNSHKYSIGIEYLPYRSDYFYQQIFYRMGAKYKNSYLELDNTRINSFAVNLGIGIPYGKNDLFNISLEYGEEGTLNHGLIKNSYFGLYLDFSLHEVLSIQPSE